jgi:ubiquinone/menaquinone biosynthesis C-methylase UbiE
MEQSKSMEDALVIQNKYYSETAASYDITHMHGESDPEHAVAYYFMCSMIEKLNVKSVLDIGAGTGRVISDLKNKYPGLRVTGIEPVAELREQGYKKGILRNDLIHGDGKAIDFPEDQYDMVCAFGILHHIDDPQRVIKEMLRVSKYAIFISDANNFGQGSRKQRFLKQAINAMGLWNAFNYIKTRGKRYQISEGDGLFYSYSVYNNFSFIKRNCRSVYLMNTTDAGINPYRSASHIALLGLKK